MFKLITKLIYRYFIYLINRNIAIGIIETFLHEMKLRRIKTVVIMRQTKQPFLSLMKKETKIKGQFANLFYDLTKTD